MQLRALIILTVLFAACSSPAVPHEGRPVYVEVTQQSSTNYELRWKIPPVIANGAEPLIRLSGMGCGISAGKPIPSLAGTHLYACAKDAKALQVDLLYQGTNPVLSTLVLYRTLDGNEQSIMAGPDETSVPLPVAETFWQVAKRYMLTGTGHILEGYDHLLFVLCLMLLSGSLKRILITVTGFTLGHSLTLGISALAGWSLPPTFVEPLIAFSILILAAEVAAKRKDTLAYRYPAMIATGFGLLHGFGFGGALAEVGLPYGLKIQALAFFNIGVEIGQLLFVIVAYAGYQIAGKTTKAFRTHFAVHDLKPLAIYPTGIMAAYWTIVRVAGIWQ